MIDLIEQARSELKTIDANFDALRKERNNLLFENQKLREDLARALETIERLKVEEDESPYV